ncbi:RAD23 family protein [Streptomyces dubilierae]|uniref:Uncharacterized protein n=1 Tax=Streptomyces dubilierae TaxID=3075533 RepID=A0ABU2P9G4_9ACTN|nr:hypothetical protein [Streptomyces sp. DSM 41921]MDT0388279.1 hypothetical protein [Streptomyces sp. DSM 41921]
MSVGFRPTEADNEIIQGHKRPGESTSDVLRRALRALDREKWKAQARADMERIAAAGEDLSDEPDDWGYDEDGRIVDLRGEPDERPSVSVAAPMTAADQAAASTPAESFPAWPPHFMVPSPPSLEKVRSLTAAPTAVADALRANPHITTYFRDALQAVRWLSDLNIAGTPTTLHFTRSGSVAEVQRKTSSAEERSSVRAALQVLQGAGQVVKIVDERSAVSASPARRAGASWKLAHLRTVAARRGSKR